MEQIWQITEGDSPLVATAIHDGHALRPEVAEIMALSEPERLREEDPFTARWTPIAATQIIGLRSRFEVDLNRPRERAVYMLPEHAWGLNVWKTPPTDDILARSLENYDAFYAEVGRVLTTLKDKFGKFMVYDLHTYNHRRGGPDAPFDDPQANPEVNVGTGTLGEQWRPIVERFMTDLRAFDYQGRQLDVRENIKFIGGQFARWIHEQFPDSGCVLSIEYKKFFMDEWTGEPDDTQIQTIQDSLKATLPGVLSVLEQM